MKIDQINGNVTAKGYENWIELVRFKVRANRKIHTHRAGVQSNRGSSVPSFSEISITKRVDEISPILFLETCTGKAKDIQIHFCLSETNIYSYFEITLNDVLLSGSHFSGNSNPNRHPMETFSLNYSKLQLRYIPYTNSHDAAAPISAGYDLIMAKKI